VESVPRAGPSNEASKLNDEAQHLLTSASNLASGQHQDDRSSDEDETLDDDEESEDVILARALDETRLESRFVPTRDHESEDTADTRLARAIKDASLEGGSRSIWADVIEDRMKQNGSLVAHDTVGDQAGSNEALSTHEHRGASTGVGIPGELDRDENKGTTVEFAWPAAPSHVPVEIEDKEKEDEEAVKRMEVLMGLNGPTHELQKPSGSQSARTPGDGRDVGKGWNIPGFGDENDDDLESWCCKSFHFTVRDSPHYHLPGALRGRGMIDELMVDRYM
jgi:hypothetical protein